MPEIDRICNRFNNTVNLWETTNGTYMQMPRKRQILYVTPNEIRIIREFLSHEFQKPDPDFRGFRPDGKTFRRRVVRIKKPGKGGHTG